MGFEAQHAYLPPLPEPAIDVNMDNENDVEMTSLQGEPSTPTGAASGHRADSPGAQSPVGSSMPGSREEERRTVLEKPQAADGLIAGHAYCLINRKWHVQWLQWVGDRSVQSPKHGPSPDLPLGDSPMSPGASSAAGSAVRRERSWTKDRPGPIDNSDLLEPSSSNKLKRNIYEHSDYELVSEEVWSLLHSWYNGGPVIKRRAIQQPNGTVIVELYGITLNVYKSSDKDGAPVAMMESKMTTVEAFKKRACQELGLDASKVRMWDYFNKRRYANLEESLQKSLDNCRIYDANDMFLEEQLPDGTWPPDDAPRASSTVGSHWTSQWDSSEDVSTAGTPLVTGCVGLQNLGNTCFMNSSLQCLSSIHRLNEYFLSGDYERNKNPTAFKTKGKLAEAYAQLLKRMWSPNTSQVAPRNFKWQIGQFAEQFAGYGQQDSMEFIEYVLDGLKEDLNLVQGAKPYVELKEADGRDDSIVADEARQGYKMRNDSRIDDYFLGFFKSTVTCPQPGCGRVSVTFDPFLSVKLTLVSATEERSATFDVYVVYADSPKTPIKKHSVSVMKFGNAKDLLEATAEKAGLKGSNCILTEVYAKKIYKWFSHNDAVDQIGTNDTLVMFEVPDSEGLERTHCEVVLYYRQGVNTGQERGRRSILGIPVLAYMSKGCRGSDLIDEVKAELVKRFGSGFDGQWKLYRTMDKWNIENCSNVIEPTDSVTLEDRVFLVLEFDERFEVPEAMTNTFEERRYGSTSSGGGAASRGSNSIDLHRCFQMYTEEDKLSPMDTWYCNRCKEHREAYKKMEFWSLPSVLVIQLKRFTYTSYTRDRLDTAVQFPLEGLDLNKYRIGPTDGGSAVYDLISVSKHMGGLGGGHYVAYARSSENGKWYYFNDQSVSASSPEQVAEDTVGAYVLFYLRRDHRPESWGEPAC